MQNKTSKPSAPKPSASKPSAFSLIELSIVLIIIGLLAGGIVAGSVLVKRARIESAKSLTNKSPIKATEDLAMWFEGSLSDSFANGQSVDNTSIDGGWNNIGGINNVSSATVDGTAPIYANSINSIPAVKFEGSNALKVGASAINSSDYTIIIAEQRESNKADNYFLGDPSITGTNQNLLIGYKTDGTIFHSQGGSTSYTSAINAYSAYSGARIIVVTHSSTEGNKTYINGILAGQLNSSGAKDNIADLANLSIGKNYIGQIGELAVFKRALSATEITDISDYMSNKWRIKVDAKNTDCSTGIVTESGCDASSCPVSIAGISKTSVNGTTGTATLSCDKTGYSGSITYSCINKTFATTPANASCSCATGYALSNGFCIPSCNVPTTNGITTTQVTGNNGTINCTATGYTGSVAYSCASQGSNATITGSCSCATGYSLVNGACVTTTCPVSVAGISSPSSVSYASTSTALTCNATGYTGFVNYTCTTGTLSATGSCSCATGYYLSNGSCVTSKCSSPTGLTGVSAYTTTGLISTNITGTATCGNDGYSGSLYYKCNNTVIEYYSNNTYATKLTNTPTCSCATGYILVGGVCVATTCPVSVTGISSPSSVSYTSTSTALTCNATGYTGSVNYTCTTGTLSATGSCSCATGYSLVSGVCTPITCTAPAGTGYLAQSNLSYGTNSFPCNAVGYSGSKNYTCSGGVANITGGTCGCSTGYTGFAGGICISNSYIYSVDNRQALVSPNYFEGMNGYKLTIQPDRNLVLYNSAGSPVWWSGTAQSSSLNHRVCIQSDGNLVVYNSSNNSCNSGSPAWDSATWTPNAKLVVGYQGQVRIYSSDGNTLLRSLP